MFDAITFGVLEDIFIYGAIDGDRVFDREIINSQFASRLVGEVGNHFKYDSKDNNESPLTIPNTMEERSKLARGASDRLVREVLQLERDYLSGVLIGDDGTMYTRSSRERHILQEIIYTYTELWATNEVLLSRSLPLSEMMSWVEDYTR